MVKSNQAFLDGQNLYLGTTRAPEMWTIDLTRFRVYLRYKYRVEKAFYFIGCFDLSHTDLYTQIQAAGYILVFREHNSLMAGKNISGCA